jgi:predicted nucleic acid-binding protein
VIPFEAEAARVCGLLSAEIGHGGADLQIAATALVVGFTVATRNTRHYCRFPSLLRAHNLQLLVLE